MELQEAKEILKDWIEYEKQNKDIINKANELIEVQETLLNYIEKAEKQLDLDYVDRNYVSKEKIKEKIKRIENVPRLTTADEAKIDVLQELLGKE